IALHVGHQPVRARPVGLRLAAVVKPSLERRAVLAEYDCVVAEAFEIGIEIDVVIVRREQRAVALARGHQLAELWQRAVLRIGRVDIGQAVIVAPTLPVGRRPWTPRAYRSRAGASRRRRRWPPGRTRASARAASPGCRCALPA